MKQNFRGWTSVYSFTFRQCTKGLGFRLVTVLIALAIFGLIAGVNIYQARPEKKGAAEASPIKTVYVLDNSGLQPTSFKDLNPELSKDIYKNVTYKTVNDQTREDVIKTASKDSKHSIAVIITATDTGYQLEAAVPSDSSVSKGQAGKLLDQLKTAFESNKLMQSGLTVEQLTTVLTPTVTTFAEVGESSNEIVYAIKMISPMLFSLMVYLMLLLYGTTISKSVASEKTSKLMETLLTSIHPYALVTGKILAVATMAVMQFVSWIAAGFIGLYGGNAIAHSLYPDYQNSVISIFNFIKENLGDTALSPVAVVLAIIFFCIGLLFYFVLAGLTGCMVSKPEEAASTQQLFVMPIVISFLITYMAPLYNNQLLEQAVKYIPFTAPFCVPSDLLTGTIGLGQGLIAFAVLIIFTFLFIMLSGRIYKGLILYSGQKVSFKMIGNIIKNKN